MPDTEAQAAPQPVQPAGADALRQRKRAELTRLREALQRFRSSMPAIDTPWRPERPQPQAQPWDREPLPTPWRKQAREDYDPAGPYRPPEAQRLQPLALAPVAEPGGRNLFEAARR